MLSTISSMSWKGVRGHGAFEFSDSMVRFGKGEEADESG